MAPSSRPSPDQAVANNIVVDWNDDQSKYDEFDFCL